MNHQTDLYKKLELLILKILENKDAMYGYEITQKIKALNKQLPIDEGSLYPILHHLEATNMLISETRPFENRTRKYYKLASNKNEIAVLNNETSILQKLTIPILIHSNK